MRLRPDGYLEAETFEEHMAPDVHWVENPEFSAAFAAFAEGKEMTTKVSVDAHAGWPVAVVTRHGEPGQSMSYTTHLVEPNTVKDFYIHSGMQIVAIEECPRPKVEPEETHGDGA